MVLIEQPWGGLARVPAMTLQVGVSDTLALPAVPRPGFTFSRLLPSGEEMERMFTSVWGGGGGFLNHWQT